MAEGMRETESRVEQASPENTNRMVRRQLEVNVVYFARHVDEIDARLEELNREWDMERVLQLNAGIVGGTGALFGLLFGRKWFLLPAVAGGFLVQHAVTGWCPPVEVLRRLGVRTTHEINLERFALKALRGDFRDVTMDGQDPTERASRAMNAAEYILGMRAELADQLEGSAAGANRLVGRGI